MSPRRATTHLLVTLLALTLCSIGTTAVAQGTASKRPAAAPTTSTTATSTTSTTAVITNARAERKAKFARPGRYKGNFYTDTGKKLEPFTFRVSKNGRRLTKFRAYLDVICSYYPPTVETHPMGFPRTKIKKNHTFKRVWKPNKKSRIMLKGKFKGKRLVSGRINYLVGICVRTGGLKAKRVGK